MFYRTPLDIRVSIDVGCKSHLAVGLSTGEFLEEFSINHQPEGFRLFFAKLEQLEQQYQCPVRVAMEGSDDLRKLSRLHLKTLRKIPGIGAAYASRVQRWQKQAQFSAETEWVGEMIQQDATRILELHNQIKTLEAKMAAAAAQSKLAGLLALAPSVPPKWLERSATRGGLSRNRVWRSTWEWPFWTTAPANTRAPKSLVRGTSGVRLTFLPFSCEAEGRC